MMWLIILSAVLLVVSLIVIFYAVAHAMDYDPSWDEEDHDDYT